MELKDFVQNTLEQIVEGVAAAQMTIDLQGGGVNPASMKFLRNGKWNGHDHPQAQDVTFDVALTEIDNSDSAQGIGVFFGGVSLGTKSGKGAETVAITRVQFTVPLVLPPGKGLIEESD